MTTSASSAGRLTSIRSDFVLVFDPLEIEVVRVGLLLHVGVLCDDVAQRFGHAAADHAVHDDAAGNHGEVRRQRAFAAEPAKDGIVLGQEGHEDFADQIVDVFLREADAAGVCRVVDHVHEQAHEAVDKVLPRTRLFGQAPLEEIAIDFGEAHVTVTPAGVRSPESLLTNPVVRTVRWTGILRERIPTARSSLNLNGAGISRPYAIYDSPGFWAIAIRVTEGSLWRPWRRPGSRAISPSRKRCCFGVRDETQKLMKNTGNPARFSRFYVA